MTEASPAAPKWRPLNRVERRVVGVLVEKAKTTPDAYPMTLNALVTGCNQKNNREPQMSLAPEAVEQALESLRHSGAVVEVQGAGRVPKYRHFLYEWLDVEKVEMAVMAELLLRGEQTVGELRGRASRMEPIASLDELKPILKSLESKNLVISLTPEGRGQIVTHNLHPERELNEIKSRVAAQTAAAPFGGDDAGGEIAGGGFHSAAAGHAPMHPAGRQRGEEVESLRREVEALRDELAALRDELAALRDVVESVRDDLARLKS